MSSSQVSVTVTGQNMSYFVGCRVQSMVSDAPANIAAWSVDFKVLSGCRRGRKRNLKVSVFVWLISLCFAIRSDCRCRFQIIIAFWKIKVQGDYWSNPSVCGSFSKPLSVANNQSQVNVFNFFRILYVFLKMVVEFRHCKQRQM